MLKLLEVSLIEFDVALVLLVARLEKHLASAPFKRMTQLQVAHGLLLHTFDTESLQGLLVLD